MNLNPNTYKNNYAALQAKYPELALILSLVKIEKYQLVQHENCLPNVIVNGQFYYQGSVDKYCEEQFKGFKLSDVKVPVFCGMGLGYEIFYWMQTQAEKFKSQYILIIEPDLEMFQCAMNIIDLTPIINHDKVRLFVGIAREKLYSVFRDFYARNLQIELLCGATQPIFLYSAMKMHKDYYIQAMQTLYEAMYHCIQNFGNSPDDSLIGVENMLDNIKQIADNPGINLLYDKFKDKPAVIVATGPSLKKNMHLLKDIKDKALIISCDATFKLLMENDIKPHMVASLEREHAVQQFFEGYEPKDVEDVYMTACPVLFNHVYESYNGPKIIVYRNFDHFKWLGIERGILDIKLSSSNMAFKIAEALGCDPIILIGQDLAYGEDGATHATEVPFSAEGEGIFEVQGNIREKVTTNSGWYGFLKAYEYDIAQHKGQIQQSSNIYGIPEELLINMKETLQKKESLELTEQITLNTVENMLKTEVLNNKKVINCTEGGAYIQGTEVSKFADAISKYMSEDIKPLEIIKQSLKSFTDSEKDTEHLQGLIIRTEEEVRSIINLCITGAAICKKYENEMLSYLADERLKEIQTEIMQPRIDIQTKYGETFQKFLMHVVQSVHLKFEMECAMMSAKEMLLKYIEWYSFIGDISEICLDSLTKAKEKLYAKQ